MFVVLHLIYADVMAGYLDIRLVILQLGVFLLFTFCLELMRTESYVHKIVLKIMS